MNNLRPCIFIEYNEENEKKECKGYFHRWGQMASGNVAWVIGIVEKENGEIVQKRPPGITFTDR